MAKTGTKTNNYTKEVTIHSEVNNRTQEDKLILSMDDFKNADKDTKVLKIKEAILADTNSFIHQLNKIITIYVGGPELRSFYSDIGFKVPIAKFN